ncbi:MAG TPA: hypothetical protein DCP31_05645 [Cyanobacteria bacterium UBA8543]|nr:hypothetical protein [Cyanobacteria bacterium UBA8543]
MSNLVLAAPAQDGATRCEQIENGWRYRCTKSGYGADKILIQNRSNERVLFDIDKWVKPSCSSGGGNFVNKTPFDVNAGDSKDYSFEKAAQGTCIEITIMDCRTAGATDKAIACPQFLDVIPIR